MSAEDHHVADERAADGWVAGMVDVGGLEPDAAGVGGGVESGRVVCDLNVGFVGEEREGEGVVYDAVLDKCAVSERDSAKTIW